ncbi:MAG TPA: YbfB/YjiJ family MFS transporter [Burkholderiaceae bacterium]|jgi:predicted MFS family arabinose efflux permease|nr:YbfB/YjiJ family MFS transporter [Burkholderiaceae bacterium]
MSRSEPPPGQAWTVALVGLASLASAMGIGRFAFTPLLPLMQDSARITLAQGAWIASANYLGYLIGAVASYFVPVRAPAAARWGLIAVAGSTLPTAFADSFAQLIALRLIAGVASAFVLIGASGWALSSLALRQRLRWSGWVFAGVGTGICLAGLTALVVASVGAPVRWAWGGLGALAAAVAVLAWRPLETIDADLRPARPNRLGHIDSGGWTLIACYGAFGFGYILPATFIPAAARSIVQDPTVFALAWPLFGLAAAVSTVAVSHGSNAARPRAVAGWSFIVMALGVGLPVVSAGLGALCLAAVCVGGTFMVATMTCMQEAQRIERDAPGGLIAAMTAAFALGQLIGPLTVTSGPSVRESIAGASAVASGLLLLAGVVLLLSRTATRTARKWV